MSKQQWGHGFHAGKKAATKGEDFPVNYLVHIPGDGQKIKYQGKVIQRVGEKFAVQLFSWLDGYPTKIQVFPISDIEQSTFYDNPDDWRDAGAEWSERIAKEAADAYTMTPEVGN